MIQEEREREAMSAGMRSSGKRSRDNNEENNTARKEKMWCTDQQATGRTVMVSAG